MVRATTTNRKKATTKKAVPKRQAFRNDCCKTEGHICRTSPPQKDITTFFSPVTPARNDIKTEDPTNCQGETHIVSPQHKILLETAAATSGVPRTRLNPSQTQNKQSCKLTEFFPVRRSARRPKNTLLEERHRSIEEAILTGREEGLEIHQFPDKGRGVVAARSFSRGEFVVEYAGELIDVSEARVRESLYASDQNTGCYMYYFKHRNVQYCIDATAETERLGRLVNHSRQGNLQTRTVLVKNKPHLVLVARTDIREGEEVLYDYGDRSKESLLHHPWLAC